MDPFEVRMQFLALLRRLDAYVPLLPARPDVLNDRQFSTVHQENCGLCAEVLLVLRRGFVGLYNRGVPEGTSLSTSLPLALPLVSDSEHSRQNKVLSEVFRAR